LEWGRETMAGKMCEREREVAGDPLALKLADNEKERENKETPGTRKREKRDMGQGKKGKRKEVVAVGQVGSKGSEKGK